MSGLFVAKDGTYTLVDARDLGKLTGLSTPVVTQKQRFVVGVGWELVRWHLEGMFGKVEDQGDGGLVKTIQVCIRANLMRTFANENQGHERGEREADGRARSDARMDVQRR